VMLTPAAAQRYVSSVCRRWYRLLIVVLRPQADREANAAQ
jgi:hypothetical protein